MSGRRVLFLTHTLPIPPVSGGRIRSLNLMKQLRKRDWRVSLFSLDLGETPRPEERALLEELCERIERHPFSERSAARYFHLLGALASGRAFQSRFFYDASAAEAAAALLENGGFEAVVVDQLYMYPYVPQRYRRVTVLDAHNVELQRIESIARAGRLSVRRIAAKLQQRPVRAYEAHAAAQVARIAAVSREDAEYFETLAPGRVEVVSNGVDCSTIEPRTEPGPRRVLFLGSLDYGPNVDGLSYLVRHILPRLEARDVEVAVVGSNPRPALHRILRDSAVPVSLVGFVEDITTALQRARMLVVPLRSGGGTRLKILDALAHGTPVVTTSIGSAGLELAHGEHVLVADAPVDFARSIDRLLRDDDLCRRLARDGRAAVERRYDWDEIGEAFERAVSDAARSSAGGNG